MADDALAVLDAASAASAHVYGVSMGGVIALQLALDHPGRVRSLTLGCTAASAEGASRGALLTRVRSLVPAAALNRMAWKLLYAPDTPASRRAEDQQIVRRTRSSGRGRRGQLIGAASFDATGRLREIRIPTLVIHGALDRIVPAVNGRRLAGGVAGARLVVFPDAGHVYITDVARCRQPGGPALPRRYLRLNRQPRHRPGSQPGPRGQAARLSDMKGPLRPVGIERGRESARSSCPLSLLIYQVIPIRGTSRASLNKIDRPS